MDEGDPENGAFGAAYRGVLRRARFRRAGSGALAAMTVMGPLILGVLLVLWVLSDPRIVRCALAGWVALPVFGAVVGLFLAHLTPRVRREIARTVDRELDGGGLFVAATYLAEGGAPSRLSPLVLEAAGQVQWERPRPRGSQPLAPVSLLLACAAASFLVLIVRSPLEHGGAESPKGAPVETRGRDPANALNERSARGSKDGAGDGPALDELVRLEFVPDKQLYGLGEEIFATLTLVQLAGAGREIPLEVVIAATDGLPSVDRGFGPGMVPLHTGLAWKVGAEPGIPSKTRIELKVPLEGAGLYGPGLITMFAAAAPRAREDSLGAIRSNQVTVQIVENMDRMKVKHPSPSVAQAQQEEPKREKDPEARRKGEGGEADPKDGPPDTIPEFERKASIVKPLLNDAELVEKEVEVYDRERGGKGTPPPEVPQPFESPTRTFIRRAEESIGHFPFSPRDRNLLEDYWNAVRRRGG